MKEKEVGIVILTSLLVALQMSEHIKHSYSYLPRKLMLIVLCQECEEQMYC